MEAIQRHAWPGNIRALRNLVERTSVLCRGRAAGPADLWLPAAADDADSASSVDLAAVERLTILRVLERCGGHRTRAAKLLGISESTLRRKLKEYNVDS